jgi:2'-5' RNA ligase
MEFYRTFIGIPLKVGDDFLYTRKKLIEVLDRDQISWVHPGNYHVTLRFLGDTELGEVKRIRNALRDRIRFPPEVKVHTSHLDSFGPRKKPRVIWIGFKDASFFTTMKEQVDNALQSVCIETDQQGFRAHLTLGRIRALENLSRFYDVIEEMKYDFKGVLHPRSLVFFRSELGSQGPRYTSLEEIRSGA